MVKFIIKKVKRIIIWNGGSNQSSEQPMHTHMSLLPHTSHHSHTLTLRFSPLACSTFTSTPSLKLLPLANPNYHTISMLPMCNSCHVGGIALLPCTQSRGRNYDRYLSCSLHMTQKPCINISRYYLLCHKKMNNGTCKITMC